MTKLSERTVQTVQRLVDSWVTVIMPPSFTRQGKLVWVDAQPSLSRVMEVRRVNRPQDDRVHISVEYGFYVPGFAEMAWPEVNQQLSAANGPYTGRIGCLMKPPSDIWWFVKGHEIQRVLPNQRSSVDLSDSELGDLLANEAVPLLLSIASVQDLLRLGPEYEARGLLELNLAMYGADSYQLLLQLAAS